MERLTFEGNFCDIAQCRELPCKYDGNCTQKQVWERLKAYEDSGDTVWALIGYAREPRECKVEFVNIGNGYTTIILRTADDAREQCGVLLLAFGRTVFLTHEEAEKALRKMKGDTEK